MSDRIFLAGATGVVGRRLVPLLVNAGYEVHGTTRSREKAHELTALGAKPWIVNVFDAGRLAAVLQVIRPSAVVHQLTDLPARLAPANMAEAIVRNAYVRTAGTRNLVAAALSADCHYMVAQSIAWAYAPGAKPYDETQDLDLEAEGDRAVTVRGVEALETAVLSTPGMRGAVLRYGHLYGPGTGHSVPQGPTPLHVDAAASAALLVLRKRAEGPYNLSERSDTVSVTRAVGLGWFPAAPERPTNENLA